MANLRRSPEERRIIRRAIRHADRALGKGLIKKGPCAHCGKRPAAQPPDKQRFHMHHDDYFRPLDITWLCASATGGYTQKSPRSPKCKVFRQPFL